MEKIKDLFIKLKDKFINFCKWVWKECKDWHTVVIFIIVVVLMYSPVWGGYLLHAVFGWKWCSVAATTYLAFWAGPFTPFFPLCIAITLGIRRIIDKIKGKNNINDEVCCIVDKQILIENIDKLHTTEMGAERIKKNLNLDTDDVVEYCKNKVLDNNCNIYKQGKNWYCEIDNIKITVNSHSYTIITAHMLKEKS